ncbi:PEGA domain-containing protein [Salidesulfovibrio onnuriiensis]|uniref:PEGA domain-containing protein n=1 Tax=Salidesulfovibrio onnuriiensis TaxID=2583823 RepID=UPI0011CBCCA0|nr:PEGA domain-containing protein [Salidesulfovibrio onnuriiensis]
MKISHSIVAGILLLSGLMAGCQAQVFTQAVPVSSNPMGADLYVDGKMVGQTPTSVELERNRDHILTLKKEQYRQEDVIIKRKYQQEKVTMNAVSEGLHDANFFKDDSMGVMSGVNSIQEQEQSGEAYVLTPSAVSVALTPQAGTPAAAQAASELPTLATLSSFDQQVVGRILEREKSGKSLTWKSPDGGIEFHMTPEAALDRADGWHRPFLLTATRGGRTQEMRGEALREGDGHWRILTPEELSALQAAEPPTYDGSSSGALKGAANAAAAALPSVGKDWSSSHESSHTSVSGDGSSMTKTTTETKTSVGVHVNPAQLLEGLESLEGDGGDGQ